MADQVAAHEANNTLAQVFVGRSREASSSDIFQTVRMRERFSNDIATLNEYVKAYFASVHPLLPVLHKEAFLKLYRLYGLKALAANVRTISDGSTLEGRAVGLICAVLALGSLSLVETRNKMEEDDSSQSTP